MSELFGHTRARVAARHALITPHNHVASSLPGFTDATAIVLISPVMGARFAQTQVTFNKGGAANVAASDVETFGYFMSGGGTLGVGTHRQRCEAGGFFFAPAGQAWTLTAPKAGTQLTLFQKKFQPLAGAPAHEVLEEIDGDFLDRFGLYGHDGRRDPLYSGRDGGPARGVDGLRGHRSNRPRRGRRKRARLRIRRAGICPLAADQRQRHQHRKSRTLEH